METHGYSNLIEELQDARDNLFENAGCACDPSVGWMCEACYMEDLLRRVILELKSAKSSEKKTPRPKPRPNPNFKIFPSEFDSKH